MSESRELIESALFYIAESRLRLGALIESPELDLTTLQELASIDASLRMEQDRIEALKREIH